MKNIRLEKKERYAVLFIDRPKALNALNRETLEELKDCLTTVGEESGIEVLIITGAGEKAFVAGADIKEMENMTPLEAESFARLANQVFSMIHTLPQPVIAAVNGYALGGGCELAMVCDIRYASAGAKFGQPEAGLGITPGFGGTQNLPRLVGRGYAMEMLLGAGNIDAAEALRIGLVNKVAEDALAEAEKLAGRILTKGPVAIRQIKKLVNNGLEMDNERSLSYEAQGFALCFASSQQKEGMSAFSEKRPPQFK